MRPSRCGCTPSRHRCVVEIADTGPGLSEEHRAHVFERFYRVDEARTRRTDRHRHRHRPGPGHRRRHRRAHQGHRRGDQRAGEGRHVPGHLPAPKNPGRLHRKIQANTGRHRGAGQCWCMNENEKPTRGPRTLPQSSSPERGQSTHSAAAQRDQPRPPTRQRRAHQPGGRPSPQQPGALPPRPGSAEHPAAAAGEPALPPPAAAAAGVPGLSSTQQSPTRPRPQRAPSSAGRRGRPAAPERQPAWARRSAPTRARRPGRAARSSWPARPPC
jgi:hypothetical protein